MVSEEQLDAAWNAILVEFGRRSVPPAPPRFDAQALGVVRCAGASELLVELCAEHVRSDIDTRLIPAFWGRFAWAREEEVGSSPRRAQCSLFSAVHEIVGELSAHARALRALEQQLLGIQAHVLSRRVDQLLLHAHSLLLVRVPPEIDYALLAVTFWEQSFRDYCAHLRSNGKLAIRGAQGAEAERQAASDDADEEEEEGEEEGEAAEGAPSVRGLLSASHLSAIAHFARGRAAAAAASSTQRPGRLPHGAGGGGGAGVGGGVPMEVEGEGGSELELLLGAFSLCCAELSSVGWLAGLEEALSLMLSRRVQAHVHATCAGRFERRLLPSVLSWLACQLLPWLEAISHAAAAHASIGSGDMAAAAAGGVLAPAAGAGGRGAAARAKGGGGGGGGGGGACLVGGMGASDWPVRLRQFVHETFGALRIDELFEIVRDFGDSRPALEDLAACLCHTHQHARLAASLRAALEARLLRPGAATKLVLQLYIQTIQALHVLDPTGVLLQAVCAPVCAYLQRRADTVRQIIHALLDEEVAVDLAPSLGAHLDSPHGGGGALGHAADDDSDVALRGAGLLDAAMAWEPLPINADLTGSAAARARGDVLSILIGIYGSREVFVAEYRSMLADKILAAPSLSDFNSDKERKCIELLKVRFGEAALQTCETMLRDLTESRRLARTLGEAAPARAGTVDACLGVTVLSRQCWPPLDDQPLRLHPSAERSLARFGSLYAHHKSPRKLVWKKSLGTVTLDVQIGGQTVRDVVCTPAQASLMLHFADKERWRLSELAAQTEEDAPTVRRRLAHWLNRGFIVEVEGSAQPTFEVAASLGEAAQEHEQPQDDEGSGSAVVSASAAAAAEGEIYCAFVANMLTNLGALPLGRIHSMLKMFVAEPVKYDKSEQQLHALLMGMVEEEKLDFSDGKFSLKPQ